MIKRIILISIGLLFTSISYAADSIQNPEIRKMTPPNLSEAHLGKRILCYRPYHPGGPKFDVEAIDGKVIAHNYGHGGAGWSMGPGSANHVVKLLEDSEYAKNLNKNTPITIIGAGVIGLYTAYTLQTHGYKHITVVADKFNDLASNFAGGTFSPHIKMTDRETRSLNYLVSLDSLRFYQSIAKQQHPIFKSGAKIIPAYFQNTTDSSLEPFVGDGILPAKAVILDFGTGKRQEMIVYDDGVFIDVEKMMQLMTDYLKKHKVKFVKQKINTFSEIKDNVIINCTGLGAKQLNSDDNVKPVQGHLIMLKNQNPENLQNAILFVLDSGVTKHDQKIFRMFYIFPKHSPGTGKNDVGVMGGTYIEDATPETPNEEEFETIIKNAKAFYGIEEAR